MEINLLIVFIAGIGTFLAPCIIPLVPSYLSYISGVVLEETDMKKKFKVVIHTLFFIFGFGTAFSALQVILFKFTNLAGKLIGNNILNFFFGGIIILMGLNMLGVFKISKLYGDNRISPQFKKKNIGTSYLFGFAFGFGWTPCMGPVLFTVMSYFSASETMIQGLVYIWIYTLGLGLPFLIFALMLDKKHKINFIKENFLVSEKLGGGILVIMGIILAMNKMTLFLSWGFRDEIILFFKNMLS